MLKNYPTLRFILHRCIWYFITFVVAVTINFFLPRLGDANPIDTILSRQGAISAEQARDTEEAYLREFGLVQVEADGVTIKRNDDGTPVMTPMFTQYLRYLGMVAQGDLGTSFTNYPRKVNNIVAEALPWTLALQFPTIVLGWLIGNLLGALAAYKRGIFDKFFFPASLLACSIPFFAFGMLLVYIFAETLGWFPTSGGYARNILPSFSFAFLGSALYYYILPFMSVFPVFAGGQAIGMRSMGIYELGTGYVKYAKTLGIKENKILMYIFRNAMLPQLTGLALQLGVMIGGALITEMIFSYPGLGMALLTAVQNNDYPLIQGGALLVTVTVLVANFTVDILIGFFDPRVKAGRTGA